MIIAAGYNTIVLTALRQYFEDTNIAIRLFDLTVTQAIEEFSRIEPDVKCCLLDVSYSDSRFEENWTKLQKSLNGLPTVVLHNYKNSSAKTLTKNIRAMELLSIHADPDEIVNAVKKIIR
jgi:DNA-binding NtrC family response regulator